MARKLSCFTVTWEIENFSKLLSAEREHLPCLKSPIWKTPFQDESVSWWQIEVHLQGTKVNFTLVDCSKGRASYNLDRCEMSVICSDGEVPLSGMFRSLTLFTYVDTIFGDKRQSNLRKLTLRCRMWREKTGELLISTVLCKESFAWKIERFDSSKSYDTLLVADSLLFNIDLQSNSKQGAGAWFSAGTHAVKLEGLNYIDGVSSIVDCQFLPKNFNWKEKNCSYNITRTSCTRIVDIPAKNLLQKVLPDLNLQVKIVAAFHKSSREKSALHSVSKSPNKDENTSEGTLTEDLLNLYTKGLLSDATLNTAGKSFSVHKNILANRSTVFQAMFEKEEMSEGRSGVVDIDDIDSETVDRMLVYLYADKFAVVTWEEAASLYYAADKYAIESLKRKCIDILKARLNVYKACDALVLADRLSDQELMKSTVDFIKGHHLVFSSSKWEELEKNNSFLTTKILREVLAPKRDK